MLYDDEVEARAARPAGDVAPRPALVRRAVLLPARPRTALVRQVIGEARAVHPELAGVVTVDGLLAALERDGVFVSTRPLSSALGFAGIVVDRPYILLSSRCPRALLAPLIAHEAAHVWLHVHDDRLRAARAAELQVGVDRLDQRSEREADMGARLLVGRALVAALSRELTETGRASAVLT
jgi:hypothetical protein